MMVVLSKMSLDDTTVSISMAARSFGCTKADGLTIKGKPPNCKTRSRSVVGVWRLEDESSIIRLTSCIIPNCHKDERLLEGVLT
jgi:hypothetical protein